MSRNLPRSEESDFHGLPGSPCDHRTAGPHRAFCTECAEWCHPDRPCVRCRLDAMEKRAIAIRDTGTLGPVGRTASEIAHYILTGEVS